MYDCKILADSISPTGVRLTTFQATFPRFILAEVNTHRMLSRNSASSRAIPFKKQISMLDSDPFVPEAWPGEQKGMSGGEPLEGINAEMAEDEWNRAMEDAIRHATRLSERGVHKSLVNRLLEPFMWHTSIISATEWNNFLALRTEPDAQPEFRKIALMIEEALDICKPVELDYGQWHLPLVSDDEREAEAMGFTDPKEVLEDFSYWREVSAGRCARVSYLTHDGVRDPVKDVELCARLISNGHMSPTEHQAQCTEGYTSQHDWGNFHQPWLQYRKMLPNESDFGAIKQEKAAA